MHVSLLEILIHQSSMIDDFRLFFFPYRKILACQLSNGSGESSLTECSRKKLLQQSYSVGDGSEPARSSRSSISASFDLIDHSNTGHECPLTYDELEQLARNVGKKLGK